MGDDYLLHQQWVYNGLIELDGRERGWENISAHTLSIMNIPQREEWGKAIIKSSLDNTPVMFDPWKYSGGF